MDAVDEPPTANLLPTPAVVLGWIAAAGEQAWFPLAHAQEANVPRDALDEPLAALRLAGLIQVRDWVKGLGQGYAITADGARLVHEPHKLARLLSGHHREKHEAADARPTTFDRGEQARQAILNPRPPTAVPALILANVFWFLVGLVIAINAGRSGNAYLANGDPLLLDRLGAVSGLRLLAGEWWRLLTNAFVHIGILHLLLNMYALGSLGSVTEAIWGLRKFLVLYFASAIGGSCLAMAVVPNSLLAGASAAFWGLMASLIAWLVLHRQHLPTHMVNDSLKRLGVLVLIMTVVSFVPGVSWAGHFGGGLIGAGVACLFVLSQRVGVRGRWLALTLTLAVVAACVGGLVSFAQTSERWLPLRTFVHLKQLNEYQQAVQKAMQPIQTQPIEKLYRAVNEVAQVNANRPDLPEQVKKLHDDAQAFDEFVTKHPQPRAVTAEVPLAYRSYATAVQELAAAMQDVLRNPAMSLQKLHQHKRVVDQRRLEIQKSPSVTR